MEVQISNGQEKYAVLEYENLITAALQKASELAGLKGPWEVSVLLVDDQVMRELNFKYRRLDEPTDVLSFPLEEAADFFPTPNWPRSLGDIVISLERAFLQAKEYSHSAEREVAYLAVHGILHLLGYDHNTPEAKAMMREREESVLKELQLGRE